MSFMNGGAECSTSNNPLSQMSKQTTKDRSLQYENAAIYPSGGLKSMRTVSKPMSAEDQRLLESFRHPAVDTGASQMFNFSDMKREMNSMKQYRSTSGPVNVSGWKSEFKARVVSGPIEDYHEYQRSSPVISEPQDSPRWADEYRQPSPTQDTQHNRAFSLASGYGNMPFQSSIQHPASGPVAYSSVSSPSSLYAAASQNSPAEAKKWEDQFKQIEEESSSLDDLPKTEGETSATSERAEGLVLDEVTAEEESKILEGEDHFEDVWQRIKSEILDNSDEWTSDKAGPAWDRDFDEYTRLRPEFGDYQFEENNPAMEEDDPYTRGVELMNSGAKLSVAALCFEAAVRKNPEHIEAWVKLGSAQAQNEKEEPAIRALERCIQLDPHNLEALLNLSVSYTNEGYENAAYATLEKWLATKYPDVVAQARTQTPRLEDRVQLHSRVIELFIRAAQLSPDQANMDADVQVGLGVLFYGNEEYAKAIDCFNAALAVRPNDHLLWNRLGATLANSNRSEEAISAYDNALRLRPSFVRARYNLGVSCINIGCYKEAAQHLLTALYLHKTDTPEDEVSANESTNLYDTLRRIFLAMERRDLVEKVGAGMNLEEFRQEFEF